MPCLNNCKGIKWSGGLKEQNSWTLSRPLEIYICFISTCRDAAGVCVCACVDIYTQHMFHHIWLWMYTPHIRRKYRSQASDIWTDAATGVKTREERARNKLKIKRLYNKETSEPFGLSQSICTRTLRNLTRYLHRNPPEPHQASSPRPSGTSSGSCTGNFRNLTRYLHQNPLEPMG